MNLDDDVVADRYNVDQTLLVDNRLRCASWSVCNLGIYVISMIHSMIVLFIFFVTESVFT